MGPVTKTVEKKSWRAKKEDSKKWKEVRKIKKLKKLETHKNEVTEEIPEIELSTISIAVPGSILGNAQSRELRSYLAGQIARAACIYKVNEIVVFDDMSTVTDNEVESSDQSNKNGNKKLCVQFARLLQYLECPQYLRKYFFPMSSDLQYAGLMNPLDAPHHLRLSDDFTFREGIVSSKPLKPNAKSLVNIGLPTDIRIDKILAPNLRVTVKKVPPVSPDCKKLYGVVVSPDTPQKELGLYWGYSVRIAHSTCEVFTQCPYPGGYDLTIGTSDKGQSIDDVDSFRSPHKHTIIVFGGLNGLEAVTTDHNLQVEDPSLMFDFYINTCPAQGSRTIRTEEAVLITLAELKKKL